MNSPLIRPYSENYSEYLRDESRTVGHCAYVAFPTSHNEALEIINEAYSEGLLITIQCGRTGLAAGAVPYGGLILNITRMNKILGMRYDGESYYIRLQPGVVLSELRKQIERRKFDTSSWDKSSVAAFNKFASDHEFFFSPDPTETSAGIGGMVACNASGARSYMYGPTRGYVTALKLILPCGQTATIKRGEFFAENGILSFPCDSGKLISLKLPKITMPNTKNASGYYIKDDMDAIDLFIGSDGTLGLITEIEIKLLPLPKVIWGVTCFFDCDDAAADFVSNVRKNADHIASLEFFDSNALDILRTQKENSTAFSALPYIDPRYGCAVYVELHCDSEDQAHKILFQVGDIMESSGGNPNFTWVAKTQSDRDKLQFFRHAVPESVNMLIDKRKKEDPVITKLGSDMSVPNEHLKDVMSVYAETLKDSGLEYASWGHIGDNHIHVNILPRNGEDYKKGKALFEKWAAIVTEMGGAVSAEHGVGKLKAPFLTIMYGENHIDEMADLKLSLDPKGLFGRGNMFSLDERGI